MINRIIEKYYVMYVCRKIYNANTVCGDAMQVYMLGYKSCKFPVIFL